MLSISGSAPRTTPIAGFLPCAPGDSFGLFRADNLRFGGLTMTFCSEVTDHEWQAQLAGISVNSASKHLI